MPLEHGQTQFLSMTESLQLVCLSVSKVSEMSVKWFSLIDAVQQISFELRIYMYLLSSQF